MKEYIFKYYKESLCLLIILLFSLLNMTKAPLLNSSFNNYFYKQLLWIITGIILYIIIYKIKFKYIFKLRYFLFFINIFLLLYVLLFGEETNGIKAWIKLGSFTFQPSELIKITFPLVSINLIKNKKYFISLLCFLIPSILIILEPDTGNFILLLIIYIFLLISKKNKKLFLLFFSLIIILLILSILIFIKYPYILEKRFNGLLYYRFKRILNINNNFQITNALIGIGSSKILPIPINKLLIYIPEGTTDFIFSFSICNFGIMLNFLLLISYFLFLYFLNNKYKKKSYYYKKKLLGVFLVIFNSQSLYNVFMNLGLVPIMGIPLPFLSYGGSNIITYFILYSLATKKIQPILDKDNNNYKSNYRKGLEDNLYIHKVE